METLTTFVIPGTLQLGGLILGSSIVGGVLGYTAAYLHDKFFSSKENKTQRNIERALVSEEDVMNT